MAHFYGWLKNGGRAESTRASIGKGRYTAIAQGKEASIKVILYVDAETGLDMYMVLFGRSTSDNRGSMPRHVLAEGVLDVDCIPSKEMATLKSLALVEENYP